MNQYRYQLERYRGRGSRYVCPKCRHKHSFTRYIDTYNNIYISMIVWVSVTAWISVVITTHHVNTLRITLSYVILTPLCTHGRTVIYIGKMSDRPPLTSTPFQSGLSRARFGVCVATLYLLCSCDVHLTFNRSPCPFHFYSLSLHKIVTP